MYKDMFPKKYYDEFTLNITEKLSEILWNKDKTDNDKEQAITYWVEQLSIHMEMKPPKVIMIPKDSKIRLKGMYVPHENIIALSNYSLVTLLHEFRHAWQHQKFIEEDAIGWSVSLYYNLFPEKYNEAAEKNLLVFK